MKLKTEQLNTRSAGELARELSAQKEKLQKLRFDLSFNKVKNTNEIGETRKNIARIKTLLNKL